MIYRVILYLEAEYCDIEADCEEEACEIAREMAIEDDDWCYDVKEQPGNAEGIEHGQNR